MSRGAWTLALGLLIVSQVATAAVPEITVTVTVVDERDVPVSGADVVVLYPRPLRTVEVSGITDARGQVHATGWSHVGEVNVVVKKAGYYESRLERLRTFTMKNGRAVDADQAVTIGLRPIRNPIPMYARKFWRGLTIPVVNKPIGFDLIEGDWVAPYGNGRTADVTFAIAGVFNDVRDYDSTLTLAFPNAGDGLLPFDGHPTSEFISPYEAPLTGYQPEKKWRRSRTPNAGSRSAPGAPAITIVDEVSDQANYVFRVRTIRNPDGTVRSALYGKLYGDPRFAAPRGGRTFVAFTYYLNPTPNDRNLECDWRKNLAPEREGVHNPMQP